MMMMMNWSHIGFLLLKCVPCACIFDIFGEPVRMDGNENQCLGCITPDPGHITGTRLKPLHTLCTDYCTFTRWCIVSACVRKPAAAATCSSL